jgi:hypothetical protein
MICLLSFFVLIADRLRPRILLFLPSLTRRCRSLCGRCNIRFQFLEFGAEYFVLCSFSHFAERPITSFVTSVTPVYDTTSYLIIQCHETMQWSYYQLFVFYGMWNRCHLYLYNMLELLCSSAAFLDMKFFGYFITLESLYSSTAYFSCYNCSMLLVFVPAKTLSSQNVVQKSL